MKFQVIETEYMYVDINNFYYFWDHLLITRVLIWSFLAFNK